MLASHGLSIKFKEVALTGLRSVMEGKTGDDDGDEGVESDPKCQKTIANGRPSYIPSNLVIGPQPVYSHNFFDLLCDSPPGLLSSGSGSTDTGDLYVPV